MTDKFDPRSKVTNMQGRDYLEVKWRIVWFRSDHPKGGIVTEVINDDLIKATVLDDDGKILATGHGSSKKQGVAKTRPYEGAETAAIGRALAHAGYGTKFIDELEEGEHLADSPVERKNGNGGTEQAIVPQTNNTIWTQAQKLTLINAKLAKNDFAAKGMLGLSDLPADAQPSEILEWGRAYREKRSAVDAATGKPFTAQQAADFANVLMLKEVA